MKYQNVMTTFKHEELYTTKQNYLQNSHPDLSLYLPHNSDSLRIRWNSLCDHFGQKPSSNDEVNVHFWLRVKVTIHDKPHIHDIILVFFPNGATHQIQGHKRRVFGWLPPHELESNLVLKRHAPGSKCLGAEPETSAG